ncbi:NAD(P)/FAD-dependent oxidoreductase [Larkinella soli]|uniref:NAD(P)/FAD-dependent oxidoreductase n=1 Tax=Larkinella soli TaxID=1770527 RepID=UPI000FFBF6BE|nr:NAD(P)/FAD-dependent oxidoreductase [Larkinella soli]
MPTALVFDVIIIGGSYAGLSAGMTLGRALRNVLIIDGGKPCNRQTPHAHNFITQDGEKPGVIAERALRQVLAYPTVRFMPGTVVGAGREDGRFVVKTEAGETFLSRKLLFATGIADQMPGLPGFAECWGISVLHCPYCHGYEVHGRPLGVLGNGDMGFELAGLIRHWTPSLTLFTHGPASLTGEQQAQLERLNIEIIEKPLAEIEHRNGTMQQLRFGDATTRPLTALFARVPFTQHCPVPQDLGCTLKPSGHLNVDAFFRTEVPGIYAAGDNCQPMRSVAVAVSAGMQSGAFLNKELIEESA